MTTRELAGYLRLNERTVLKLAAAGDLPGARLGTQWRFRRDVIDAWLDDQMLGLRAGARGEPAHAVPASLELDDCFRPDHVSADLAGTTMPAALQELAARAAELELIRDRTWFLGALIERENTLSSAVGSGVAFPHTLERHPDQVTRPFLVLGRSSRGIDFGAADGQPVQLIIVMGLRHQELHLPWLARLSRMLKSDQARRDILSAEDAAAIHAAVCRHVAESARR